MLGLPRSTEFNKRIPKQKFYENLTVSPALKKVFVDQIRVIYWKNKIAASTVNIAPGSDVTELEVFEVLTKVFSDRLIRRSLTISCLFFLMEANTRFGLVIKKLSLPEQMLLRSAVTSIRIGCRKNSWI